MKPHATFTVRCRAIILHEDKILVLKRSSDIRHAMLPGGHLEFGEDVQVCIRRELKEELGVEASIGRLLYVNCFKEGDSTQTVEFIFEVTNGADFLECEKLDPSQGDELANIYWLGKNDSINLLPSQIQKDFHNGSVLLDEVRYIGIK